MSAADIARALGGRKTGTGWMARCPSHDDHTPSLSVSDAAAGVVLVCCHAGCDQSRVIAGLRARGLWAGRGCRTSTASRPTTRKPVKERPNRDDAYRTQAAMRIWEAARPASGTAVATYVKVRGINIPMPPTVRFHPALKHPDGGSFPAMVALVTGANDQPLGIHRTFLGPDGTSKADVENPKMMLGPCRGGAVRLGAAAGVVLVGEGIETCLAAMQATGMPTWAALSTSGLRTLDLPEEVREAVVLADGDDAGEAAAQDAALRWKRERRHVRIARPPRGLDFNDVLLGRCSVESTT